MPIEPLYTTDCFSTQEISYLQPEYKIMGVTVPPTLNGTAENELVCRLCVTIDGRRAGTTWAGIV